MYTQQLADKQDARAQELEDYVTRSYNTTLNSIDGITNLTNSIKTIEPVNEIDLDSDYIIPPRVAGDSIQL